ncbi:conjugal transfer protein TrbL family protein [Desulfitibacter alkalitolerans]|uniref:conjugal transfer protein TrbL family protein n=1 Tax=Desulfitibacter alkalitolerans TaxID=264641 RepID=UPI000485316D|nr:conjugal transfer protein TrbL family protein [Desulfitibacter alkalitolerans]
MFIWDFAADTVLGQIMDWIYAQIIGFLGEFFAMMGNMGAELFEMSWVQAIVLFFSYLAWALYGTGLVVSAFECGIEYQSGRGSIKDTALNAIKGFMAVSLFTIVPVELYKLAITLQGAFTSGITGLAAADSSISTMAAAALASIGDVLVSPIMGIFCLILMGYAVIKVFFANLKRGGILLIQIAVGSLYMFSVPRGYIDGFVSWCKQVVGLCLTAFLQATILVAGLMVFNSNMLLGLGLMLAASEIPRIAGQFGLDTSTRGNLMSTMYAAQTAMNITRTVVRAVAK